MEFHRNTDTPILVISAIVNSQPSFLGFCSDHCAEFCKIYWITLFRRNLRKEFWWNSITRNSAGCSTPDYLHQVIWIQVERLHKSEVLVNWGSFGVKRPLHTDFGSDYLVNDYVRPVIPLPLQQLSSWWPFGLKGSIHFEIFYHNCWTSGTLQVRKRLAFVMLPKPVINQCRNNNDLFF